VHGVGAADPNGPSASFSSVSGWPALAWSMAALTSGEGAGSPGQICAEAAAIRKKARAASSERMARYD
jgi:hypothetical protein